MAGETISKEMSWLSFNHRVLLEAMDESNPAIERARFLGIFSNNLDEFYRVRVAGIRRRILLHQEVGGDPEATELLSKIQIRTLGLNNDFENAFNSVRKALSKNSVLIENLESLNKWQISWLNNYFRNNIQRYICPLNVSPSINLSSQIADDATYLVVEIEKQGTHRYALIRIPTSHHSRFIVLPHLRTIKNISLVFLDDVIRIGLKDLYEGFFDFDHLNAWAMKLTRDAEYNLNQEIDESLFDRLSSIVKQRLTAEPTRLVHDRTMPVRVLEMLKTELSITKIDAVVGGGPYHNMKDFMGFPAIGGSSLRYKKLVPFSSQRLENTKNYFSAIREKDILLHYPYHDFYQFIEWLRQSAADPRVLSIRITLYRLAKSSLIIKTLRDAAANGKEVSAVLELTARFDEKANIKWAKVLTDSGVRVKFGISNLKIHAKLCVINRIENNKRVQYAYISTGNFNEKTAQIYTDFALFTSRNSVTKEVAEVFAFIDAPYRNFHFKQVWVSPLNQRDEIFKHFDREILNLTNSIRGRVLIKVNNLVDPKLEEKILYAAAQGVQVDLIIRGMCTLTVKEDHKNIRIVSVIDRNLEHARVFIFFNNNNPKVFLSSADLMQRNLDQRVEVGIPIFDEDHKRTIIDLMELQLNDTVKARMICGSQSNSYVKRGRRKKLRSQIMTHRYIEKIEYEPAPK